MEFIEEYPIYDDLDILSPDANDFVATELFTDIGSSMSLVAPKTMIILETYKNYTTYQADAIEEIQASTTYHVRT